MAIAQTGTFKIGKATIKPPEKSGGYTYQKDIAPGNPSITDITDGQIYQTLNSKFLADDWLDNSWPIPANTGDAIETMGHGTTNHAQIVYGAAGYNRYHMITGFTWSYSADPTSGCIQVKDGSDIIFRADVLRGGPGFIPFDPPKRGSANTSMTIVAMDGGSGIYAAVSVEGHRII